MKKSIAKNYIYNLIYQMLTILLPFITTPYISRVLGATNIGIYGYTYSIITYFVLLGSLGIALYGQREIAYVQNNKKELTNKFWEIEIIKLISMAISSIIYIFVFCINGDYTIYYRIFLLYMFSYALDIIWFFQGVEEFGKIVFRNIVIKLLSIVCIFIFIKTQADLWKYILIYVGGELLGNLSLWLYMPKYINKPNLKELEMKKHIKPVIMLCFPQIATQIYTVLDKTMIGNITKDMDAVGFYEQAQKIMRSALVIITSYGTVIASRVANIYKTQDKSKIKEHIETSFRYVFFIGIPMVLGIIAVAPKFVPWFYGEGYEEVIPLLATMSILLVVIGISNVSGTQYLIPINKQNIYTISIVIGCVVNVIFNFILINLYGAIGAVIASIIAELSISAIQIYIIRKEINFLKVLKSSLKYFISGVIMFLITYGIQLKLDVSIFNSAIEIIIGIAVYMMILVLLKDKFLKNICNQIATGIKGKLGGKVENE